MIVILLVESIRRTAIVISAVLLLFSVGLLAVMILTV